MGIIGRMTPGAVLVALLLLYPQDSDGFNLPTASVRLMTEKRRPAVVPSTRPSIRLWSTQHDLHTDQPQLESPDEEQDSHLSNDAVVEREESSSTYPPTPTFQQCMAFVLPALGIYASPALLSLIDASFIGQASSIELAALGPASSISDNAPLPLLFLSIAATNLVAKSYTENDSSKLRRISGTSIGLGAVGGALLAALIYHFADPISFLYCGGKSAATKATAEVLAPLCSKYIGIRMLALPAVVVATIAQAICIGMKDTKTPMVAVAVAGVMNFLGDLVLVPWMGLGIAGAAWATSLSQFVAVSLLLRVLSKRGVFSIDKRPVASNGDGEPETASNWDTLKQLFAFFPFLFVLSVKVGLHHSCAATAASLGGAQAAAHTALFAVASLCFTFGDVGSSLSQAFLPAFAATVDDSSTRNKKGGDKVTFFDIDSAMPTIRQLLRCTLTISTTVVCLSTALLTVFGGQITSDPLVLMEMRRALPLIVATLMVHGTAVTLEGLLLARKDLNVLSVAYTILAMSVVGFQVATRRFGLGLAGVWACYVWFSTSRAITFASFGGLLRPRRWRQKLRRRNVNSSAVSN